MLQHNPPTVVGIGMSTVDYLFIVPDLPAFGKSVRATEYLRQPGGPVSTALVTLARLGISTCFVGKVGDDLEGLFIKEEFEKEDCYILVMELMVNGSLIDYVKNNINILTDKYICE